MRQQVTRDLAMIDSLSRRFGPQHLEGLEAPRAIAASQHEAMHGSGGPAQGES
ncbi:MAG: hypothetical protein IT514_12760 [Burkholderiales bacterium]|nr:hypothetical protein [Burkholderiales bacterium]